MRLSWAFLHTYLFRNGVGHFVSLFFFLLFCAKLFKFAHMFWNFKVFHFYICVPSKVWERCHYFCVTFYFILCRQMWLIVSRLYQDICVVSSIFLLQYNITHDYDGRWAFECCFHRNNKMLTNPNVLLVVWVCLKEWERMKKME